MVCEFDLSLCNAFAGVGSDVGVLCDPPPSVIDGDNPPVPVIHSSAAQSCTADCGDDTSETYTVVAGTFVALSQAEADAQALAFACVLAQMLCLGPLPTLYTNTAQSCTALCPDGSTFSFTIPADFFTALSQAEADLNAFNFACDVAALLCSGLPPLGDTTGAGQPRQRPAQPLWANTAQSCSASCSGGGTYTYIVPGGTYLRESRTAANSAALSLACQQAQLRRVCLSALPASACLQDFFAEFLDATGLTAPITFALVSGSLPPGLTLSGALLSGVPTVAGSYTFALRATGTDGTYAQRTYSMAVVEISPALLPDGSTGTPYAAALSVTGMASPTWGLIGSLPDGVTLNPSTGVISGTPTLGGTYPFGITATEGDTECQQSYSIEITGCADWANLLWAAAQWTGSDGFNSFTFTPGAGVTGPTFLGTATTPDLDPNNQSILGLAQVPFDGADCNCNLNLDISTLLDSTVRVRVTRDDIIGPGNILLDTTFLAAEQVTDFPFIATAGTYNIALSVDMVQSAGGPASLVVQGTFTNV